MNLHVREALTSLSDSVGRGRPPPTIRAYGHPFHETYPPPLYRILRFQLRVREGFLVKRRRRSSGHRALTGAKRETWRPHMPTPASTQTTDQPAIQSDLAIVQTPAIEPATPDPAEAQAMIDALTSVGVREINLTLLDHHGGTPRYETFGPDALCRSIPRVLAWAANRQRSVIVRPVAGAINALIQLDDVRADMIERLEPVAFLGIETSPGNFQTWVAVPSTEADVDFRRRLCRGAGADPGATGAGRIAGSINFKPKHAPHFPQVRLIHTAQGRITTRAELESLGVVAAPEPVPAIAVPPSTPTDLDSMVISFDVESRKRKPRRWPDYQRCLDGASPNSDGTGPDRSRADYLWCRVAIQWGWGVEETAEQLMELSEKAQERDDDYALRTARAAGEALRRR